MTLKEVSARELLNWLKHARACGGEYGVFGGMSRSKEWTFTVEELKEELSHREHILNKKEAKELRRNRSMGKVR